MIWAKYFFCIRLQQWLRMPRTNGLQNNLATKVCAPDQRGKRQDPGAKGDNGQQEQQSDPKPEEMMTDYQSFPSKRQRFLASCGPLPPVIIGLVEDYLFVPFDTIFIAERKYSKVFAAIMSVDWKYNERPTYVLARLKTEDFVSKDLSGPMGYITTVLSKPLQIERDKILENRAWSVFDIGELQDTSRSLAVFGTKHRFQVATNHYFRAACRETNLTCEQTAMWIFFGFQGPW